MENKRRTIVGARADARGNAAAYPRGIEVLLKKAKVDAGFQERLLEDPIAAAEAIGLTLLENEKRLLVTISKSTLRLMIARTFVPTHHVKTFMSRNAPAMLALVLASTVALAGSGASEAQSKGITGEELLGPAARVAMERMDLIQNVLEEYRHAHGSYPSTEQWLTSANPLEELIPSSALYDPWNRRFHYQAIVENGEIVSFRLESRGAEFLDARDDIASPRGDHAFPKIKELRLRGFPLAGEASFVVHADHQNAKKAVDWYIDEKRVTRTVENHEIVLDPGQLTVGQHLVQVMDESGNDAALVIRADADGTCRIVVGGQLR